MEIIFNTKIYNTRVTKSPKIETNEGGPPKTVRIIADVIKRPDSTYPVVIKPYKLDISQFGDKVRDEMKFAISNVSSQDLQISLVSSATDYFEVDLPKTVAANSEVEGTLKLRDDVLDQSFEKSFTIQVSDDESTRFTVPVRRTFRKQAASQTLPPAGP